MSKQTIQLDEALDLLVKYGIATINQNTYFYSKNFEDFCSELVKSKVSRLTQMKLGKRAGKELIPQLLTMATAKPSRRDVENLITAYVCLLMYADKHKLKIEKKYVPDLTYAVWYLNDHNPTVEEVKEWRK